MKTMVSEAVAAPAADDAGTRERVMALIMERGEFRNHANSFTIIAHAFSRGFLGGALAYANPSARPP